MTAFLTAVFSIIGSISTIILAWRTDRRTAKESALKLVHMEQQILELERKLKASADDGQNKNSLIIQP